MEMKKAILSLSIIAILTICMFNSVVAAPVSKFTPDTHSNYAGDLKRVQQTYIATDLGVECATAATIGVGQSIYLSGVLSYGTPPTSSWDHSHGIANKTLNIQSMNSDGKTWTTVDTRRSGADDPQKLPDGTVFNILGWVVVELTPMAAGVYTYRMTYDGDSQYAPAVSNVVTLTVTNVVIS